MRTPINYCSICDYKIDAVSSIEDETARPKAGDISICLNCSALHIFTAEMGLRVPTEEEAYDLSRNEEINNIQRHIRERGAIPNYLGRD